MSNRYVEPWFACEVRQRFNDGLSGYIHGQKMTYRVFRDAPVHSVKVAPLELEGKYTEACYFHAAWSELVSQPPYEEEEEVVEEVVEEELEFEQVWIIVHEDDEPAEVVRDDSLYPTATLPEFIENNEGASTWALEGGSIRVRSESKDYSRLSGVLLLGSILTNGQFY